MGRAALVIRAPHIGWLVVLGLACAILLALGSAIYGYHAHRLARQAEFVLDSLSHGRWVRLDSGDVLLHGKAH